MAIPGLWHFKHLCPPCPPVPPLVDEAEGPIVMSKSRGFWGEAWLRFRRRKLAMMALLVRRLSVARGHAGPGHRRHQAADLQIQRKNLFSRAWVITVSSWENHDSYARKCG